MKFMKKWKEIREKLKEKRKYRKMDRVYNMFQSCGIAEFDNYPPSSYEKLGAEEIKKRQREQIARLKAMLQEYKESMEDTERKE